MHSSTDKTWETTCFNGNLQFEGIGNQFHRKIFLWAFFLKNRLKVFHIWDTIQTFSIL